MSEITLPTDRPFEGFGKINRTHKAMTCLITEKVDGTNAQIVIEDNKIIAVGSRKRWISPGKSTDNFGFAGWVQDNYEELLKLGEGTHFGEWYGSGIQRGYGLYNGDKRFALFNRDRYDNEERPECCEVVPSLYRGEFNKDTVNCALSGLAMTGSFVVDDYPSPEGIIVWLYGPRIYLKATFDHPEGKWAMEDV